MTDYQRCRAYQATTTIQCLFTRLSISGSSLRSTIKTGNGYNLGQICLILSCLIFTPLLEQEYPNGKFIWLHLSTPGHKSSTCKIGLPGYLEARLMLFYLKYIATRSLPTLTQFDRIISFWMQQKNSSSIREF